MILFYKNPQQTKHQRIIENLYNSCPWGKKLLDTNTFGSNLRLNQKAKAIVFAGMIRGDGLIFKWCKQHGKRFFYIDHAYLNRGYNPDPDNEWFRVTDSDFLWNKMEHRSSDRWDQYFGNSNIIEPWRLGKGKNILVLPPSQATQYLFPKSKLWLDQTVRTIKRYTDKPIIIREKPTQQIISANNQILKRLNFAHAKTIEQELEDAYAVVTYNSGVTVNALLKGIPVFCDQNNAAAPLSFKMEEMGTYILKDRQPWLHQLVYHQFLTREMLNGKIWLDLIPDGKI